MTNCTYDWHMPERASFCPPNSREEREAFVSHALGDLLKRSPASLEWLRIRLELALCDMRARRLDGVIGQYRALEGLGLPEGPICDGFRALGAHLRGAGYTRLGGLALETAALLEESLTTASGHSRKAPTSGTPPGREVGVVSP